MKKLILSLLLLISIATSTLAADIEVVNENTTISLIANEAVKDTMLIAIDGEQMYVFNTGNKLVYKVKHQNFWDNAANILFGFLIGAVVVELMSKD